MTDPTTAAASAADIARIGSHIGTYHLVDVIGRGGMGIVYRALDPEGRSLAVKLMLPDLALSDDYRERFVREAELGPRLRHPHIVEVVDAGETGGELFIAMRLIQGFDLKAFIRERNPMKKAFGIALLRQAAAGLDYAHQNGVVHLDVKPQNILLDRTANDAAVPRVYMTDFGLLRPTVAEQTTTRSNQIYGSIAYMSPEQIENLHVDGRADVYALGCVAYECFTGEIPFDRPNEMATLWAHVHEEPPRVSAKRRDLPAAIDGVLFQALAKHPDDRFLTCGDFVEDLATATGRRYSRMYPILRPLVKRTPRQKEPREIWSPNFFPELARVRAMSERPNWLAIGALATVMLGLIGVQGWREGGIPRAARDAAGAVIDLAPKALDIATDDGGEAEPAREPRRTPVAGRPPAPELDPGGANRTALDSTTPSKGGHDSRQGTAQAQDHDSPSLHSPQAGLLSFTRGTNVFVMDADGSDERRSPDTAASSSTPATSPDGKFIAYYSSRDQGSLHIVGVEGGRPRRLTPIDNLVDAFPHWSPDGEHIVFVSTNDWSNDTYEIKIVNVATGRIETLTEGRDPAWSPDGRKIAFERNMDIYLINADGSGERRITSSRLKEWHPNWAPDGKSLVFGGSQGETDYDEAPVDLDIYTIALAEGTVSRLTATPGRIEGRPCWLSNGSGIAVEALDVTSRNYDIWVISPTGETATNLTRTSGHEFHVDCGW